MQTIPHYSKGEALQLYWNGHKQPVGPNPESIKKYIAASLTTGTTIDRFTLRSNYRNDININEFLNN